MELHQHLDLDGNPEPLAIASENWVPTPEFISCGKTNNALALTFAVVPGYQYTVQSSGSLAGSNVWADLRTVTSTPTLITNNFVLTSYGSGFTNAAPYFAVTNVTVTAPMTNGACFFRLKRTVPP